jgi:choline dehydrogenase-like flavoprotein
LNHPPEQCDILIVGGGIVGLATAWHLTADYPERSVVVLEKESSDRQQFRRASFRDLLSPRFPQGNQLPRWHQGHGGVLPTRKYRA